MRCIETKFRAELKDKRQLIVLKEVNAAKGKYKPNKICSKGDQIASQNKKLFRNKSTIVLNNLIRSSLKAENKLEIILEIVKYCHVKTMIFFANRERVQSGTIKTKNKVE